MFLATVIYKIPGAKPTMYPENINGGGGSVGTLVITWDVSYTLLKLIELTFFPIPIRSVPICIV